MKLRAFQQEIDDDPARFNVACIHRRAGKTWYALKWLSDHARESDDPTTRNYYVCPYRNQAKSVAWDLIHQLTADDKCKYNATDLYVQFENGARVVLIGADGADKHRGRYADRMVLDETGQIAPGAWREVFRPMLADRLGRALFIGTPYGRSLFTDLYELGESKTPGWSSHLATAETTGIIEADELASLKREMSRSEFAREFLCDWSMGLPGAYFQAEMEQASLDERLRRGDLWKPDDLVDVSIALCAGDAIAATYWQMGEREPTLIDAHRWQQTRVDQVVKEIRAKPYVIGSVVYGQHAGRRIVSKKETPYRLQVMRQLDLKGPLMPRRDDFVDEVQITKMMLARSVLSLDAGIDATDALRQVRATYDTQSQTFSTAPVADWSFDLAVSVNAFAEYEKRGLGRRKPIDYRERFRA